MKPLRSIMLTSGKERITSIILCCAVIPGLLACLSAPVSPGPGNRPAFRQSSSPIMDSISASIAPTVISIGDMRAGDNWPSTWANDDNVYTYVSDGTGFGLSSARSMSPAKIIGNPFTGSIAGQNISTNSIGMSTGGGSSGKKVSGLISLPDAASPSGQVLYAWVRNITRNGGASLMYSYDHATTWTWAWGDPSTTSSAILPQLGYPTWMQAGKNNAAAQDTYLYFYSQNTPTAYQVADTVIMGRVDATHVKEKSAYRYFAGFDGKGNALWTADSALRKPVFSAQGQCYRVFVTYNPGLRQYFLLTANGDSLDSNWIAGHRTHNLGIYEALTPWGPWHTVYYNNYFQTNMNVFAPQIVSKWIAADGKSFYLLYSSQRSGPYRFNLQKVSLNVR
jgi:hypothetical protein